MRFEVDLPGARAVFSSRHGGVSEGPYRSLNLGILTDDEPGRIIENRRRLAQEVALDPDRIAAAWQIHGAEVREWSEPPPEGTYLGQEGPREKFDGHRTRVLGLGLLVLVADCLPVALAGGGQVAMLHCGWRGLAGGIIPRALAEFGEPPAAVIGPGIGRCCYEVGDEVLEAFADHGSAAKGNHLDLRAVAEAQLRAGGVERVQQVDLCTCCREDLFFSHRRDKGVTGRQAGIAWLIA